MQADELIWQVIGHHHCSYRATVSAKSSFCRSEYNVTGLCNRTACPLANSRYATVREEGGRCYLYTKTIERAHLPSRLWEKVQLPRNYAAALAQVGAALEHWPAHAVHKCKQRLTKIVQYLIRIRRLEREGAVPDLERVHKKVDRRERTREGKALRAAGIDKAVEAELLDRLRAGTYGDIYNFPEVSFARALERAEGEYEPDAAARAAAAADGADDDDEDDELHNDAPSDMHLLRRGRPGGEEEEEEEGEDEEEEDDDGDDGDDRAVEYVEDPDLDDEMAEAEAQARAAADLAGRARAIALADIEGRGAAAAARPAHTGKRARAAAAAAAAAAGAGAAGAGKRARPRLELEYEHEPAAAPTMAERARARR